VTHARCEVVPGRGSVARERDSLLWASEETPNAVWDTLRACLGLGERATAAGPVLVGLAETLLPRLDSGVAFALVVTDGTDGYVLRHGAVDVRTGGRSVEGGTLASIATEESIMVGDPAAVQHVADGAPAYRFDLSSGAVPGAALRWTAAPATRQLPPPSSPAIALPPPPEEEPVPLSEPAAPPPPSDVIPETTSDPERTAFHAPPEPDAPTTTGLRPGAGSLVFEDGATATLTGDVVLGRRPERHELVESGQAQPLVIHDPEHVLSSAHAAVRSYGDEVVVIDLDSLNGTHVAAPDAPDWTRLAAGAPYRIHDGHRLLLGWTVLTYHGPG